MYIDTDANLQTLCDELKKAKTIFFDTEFMREKTYYPKLCLIQIGYEFTKDGKTEDKFVAVDPLAKLDLEPLMKLLTSATRTLVFHSGSQDLEILYNESKKLPKQIFDTQIAAMVCGFGEQVSFAQLVEKLTEQKVDKSQRFTDWTKRPLSPQQIQYALNDVIYLKPIYEKLVDQLEEDKRTEWVAEEEASLTQISTYKEDPKNAWQKIKSRGKSSVDLGILQEIAQWREEKAIQRNLPRRFVMRDEIMTEIASHPPSSPKQLKEMRGIGNVSRETLQKIWEAIEAGQAMPNSKKPKMAARKRSSADPQVMDLLKILLKTICDESKVAPKLIASSSDLDAFANGEEVKFTEGWRKKIFGTQATKLLNGKLKFYVKNKKLTIEG